MSMAVIINLCGNQMPVDNAISAANLFSINGKLSRTQSCSLSQSSRVTELRGHRRNSMRAALYRLKNKTRINEAIEKDSYENF